MSESLSHLPVALPDSAPSQSGQPIPNNQSSKGDTEFQSELDLQLEQADSVVNASPMQQETVDTKPTLPRIPGLASTAQALGGLLTSGGPQSGLPSGSAVPISDSAIALAGSVADSPSGLTLSNLEPKHAGTTVTAAASSSASQAVPSTDPDGSLAPSEAQRLTPEAQALERSLALSSASTSQPLPTPTAGATAVGGAIAATLGQATLSSAITNAATNNGGNPAHRLDGSNALAPNQISDSSSIDATDKTFHNDSVVRPATSYSQSPAMQAMFSSAAALSAQFKAAPDGFADLAPQGQVTNTLTSSISAAAAVSQSAPLISSPAQVSQTLPSTVLPTDRSAMPGPATGQVADQVKVMIRSDQNEARLQLHPRELGAVNIRIALHADQADVSIEASNPELYRELSSAIPRLRQLFMSEGVGLNQLALDLGQSSQQQNGSDNSHGVDRRNGEPGGTTEGDTQAKLLASALPAAVSLSDGQTLNLYA